MSTRQQRLLILSVAILQIVAFAVNLVWRVEIWQQQGWAGLLFQALPETAEQQQLPMQIQGAILMVAPGSPAAKAGLKQGDEILSVEGVAVSDIAELSLVAGDKRVGDKVRYEVSDASGVREVTLTLVSPYGNYGVVANMTASFVVGAAFLIISLLVAWARPGSRSAFIFFLLCAAGGALFFVWAANELDFPNTRGIASPILQPYSWLLMGIYVVLSIVLSNLLFHLALLFPKPRPMTHRWPEVFTWLHTVPFLPSAALLAVFGSLILTRRLGGPWPLVALGLLLVILATWRLLRRPRATWSETLAGRPYSFQLLILALAMALAPALRGLSPSALAGVSAGLFLAVLAIFLVLGIAYSVLTCVVFLRSYRESGREAKRQVRWPLWGSTVALTGVLILLVVTFALGAANIASDQPLTLLIQVATRLLYLLIPISFAFGILRYRLLDIDILIRKTFVYGGVTTFVVLAYLVLAGLLGVALVTWAGVDNQIVTVISTLAIAALLVPARNRIQQLVDRRFDRGQERRRAELDQALDIQRSLLPEEIPQQPGLEIRAFWQPAREVAGDYYDVLPLPDEALAICIGDVVGKGMPAALLMSSLQASVKAIAPVEPSPAKATTQVRSVVCQNLTGGKFVTFFYGRVSGRALTYTNTGHNPPILIRADGEVERLETGGGVMARFLRDSLLDEATVELRGGDRLVLFTDGLSEARNRDGTDFGEDRLVDRARAHADLDASALCERLVEEVRDYADGEIEDDLTLLVLAVLDASRDYGRPS